MPFVEHKKAFDKVPRKVMKSAMRKKGIPGALVEAVMSLYEGAMTKVKVGTHLSDEVEVNVGAHQGSVSSPLLFAIVIDFVTNDINEGTLQEILYTDHLVLIAKTMAELHEEFYAWKKCISE